MTDLEVRANQAQAILDNPVWQDTWNTVKTSLVDAISHTKIEETDKRTELALQLRALNAVQLIIQAEIDNLLVASANANIEGDNAPL